MKVYLVPDEIEQLENVAMNLRDKLLVRLLFHLGCRVSEVLGLEVKDVDFKQSIVTILHLKTRIKLACLQCGANLGRSHSFCPKCGIKVAQVVKKELENRRIRTLPLDEVTLKMLENYIRRGGLVKRNGKQLIFNINRHRCWQVIRDCAKKAGLPKLVNPETGKLHNVSPHRLRDAFAIYAMKLDDSGDGLRMLQQHLGHASFNTTARYRKVSGKEHGDWYRRLWSKGAKS